MSECKRCETSFESTPDRSGALCVACHLAGESATALWMSYCDQKEELSRLREQNAEFASALLVHIDRKTCPDCERFIIDAEPHDDTCRYAPVVADARAMFEDGEDQDAL